MKMISPSRRRTDIIIDRRTYLILCVVLATGVLAWFAPHLQPDPTMKSGVSTESPEYVQYQRFLDTFGNEEFILIAVKSGIDAHDPRVLNGVSTLTSGVERLEQVEEVISLSSLALFQNRDGKFGSFPLIQRRHGELSLPPRQEIHELREFIPILDLLISRDLTTVGFIVKISQESKLNPPLIEGLLRKMESLVEESFPQRLDYRIVGAPVIVQGIHRYNIQTALTFGILCSIICTLVSFYIFKSLKVTGITLVVVGISVVWVTGFMALTGIPLNSTTGLSFGMILVVSVAAVVHIVTHYNERFRLVRDREEALKQALAIVARPCLMCSLTTATGFATITVSTIPMVRQLGIIMSLGVLASYVLAVVITPALLVKMNPPGDNAFRRMEADWLAAAFEKMQRFVFAHYRFCTVAGLALAGLMVAGAPRIRSDTQVLRMLTDRTKEMQDLRFVEENLANVHTIEIMIEAPEGTFKRAKSWQQVRAIENRVHDVPQVDRTESLLSTFQYLDGVLSSGQDMNSGELFTNPGLIPQLLAMMSFSQEGRAILHRYVDKRFSRTRISVRIINSPEVPVGITLERIRDAALGQVDRIGTGAVTGALAVFESQASDLVRAQTLSLVLALSSITILMILQFRSVILGLISLIPNAVPLTVIFGVMGWFDISLDTVTVFAATISIGLSVDDTIHFLTQFQQEILSGAEHEDISICLAGAYHVTAKALMSTSAVLFFGFLMLLLSPFRPVIAFGILGSSAVLSALMADLMFMPSIILSVKPLRNVMNRLMRSES